MEERREFALAEFLDYLKDAAWENADIAVSGVRIFSSVEEVLGIDLGLLGASRISFDDCALPRTVITAPAAGAGVEVVVSRVQTPVFSVEGNVKDADIRSTAIGSLRIVNGTETGACVRLSGSYGHVLVSGGLAALAFRACEAERLSILETVLAEGFAFEMDDAEKERPLAVRERMCTDDPRVARALHWLCPTTPLLYTGPLWDV